MATGGWREGGNIDLNTVQREIGSAIYGAASCLSTVYNNVLYISPLVRD